MMEAEEVSAVLSELRIVDGQGAATAAPRVGGDQEGPSACDRSASVSASVSVSAGASTLSEEDGGGAAATVSASSLPSPLPRRPPTPIRGSPHKLKPPPVSPSSRVRRGKGGGWMGRPPSILRQYRSSSEPLSPLDGTRATLSPTTATVAPAVGPIGSSTTVMDACVARRDRHSLRVVRSLLKAYPRGARIDSEGGRLPLHTACAGGAGPSVVAEILRAYPDAARHRNKDGYLPLHLAAHWGVAHSDVAPVLLTPYPDAVVGRNRWERTPLEEALVMAGENGRPHQVALVRALRRPPGYWEAAAARMGAKGATAPGGGGRVRATTPDSISRMDKRLSSPPSTPVAAAADALTRPIPRSAGGGHNIVDVDATIGDLSSDEDDDDGGVGERRAGWRNGGVGDSSVPANRGRTVSRDSLLG